MCLAMWATSTTPSPPAGLCSTVADSSGALTAENGSKPGRLPRSVSLNDCQDGLTRDECFRTNRKVSTLAEQPEVDAGALCASRAGGRCERTRQFAWSAQLRLCLARQHYGPGDMELECRTRARPDPASVTSPAELKQENGHGIPSSGICRARWFFLSEIPIRKGSESRPACFRTCLSPLSYPQ